MAYRSLRTAGNVCIVACLLRIWHVLLLRLYDGGTSVLAGWLVALFLLVVLTRYSLNPTVGPRGMLDSLWARLDGTGLIVVAFFLFLTMLFDWGFERAASDGREYFVQVRSLVIDGDLDFRNENALFGVRGTAEIYPFGAALLWVPFFVIAHGWLAMLNLFGATYSLDGFINPYQRAIGFGTLVYGFVGLVLIYRMLRDYFDRGLATLTTLVLCCGTFLVWYLTVENSMVHGVSMFATTFFLFLWHRGRPNASVARWAWLGASAGLMTLVRWQNVAFVVAPLAVSLWQAWREHRPLRPLHLAAIAVRAGVFTLCALAAFSPQLIFWRVVRGAWLSLPTGEHGFSVASLHVLDVLFSPNHGLLSWTPIVYLALLGLPLFFRRDRALATVLMVGFFAQLYINGAVDVWWGGSGFGARRFSSCTLVFAVGLASLLAWLRRRPLVAPVAVLGVLLFGNATLMLDVRSRRLPATEGITFANMMQSVYARAGNPFSFPQNAMVAWKYDVGLPFYDGLKGRTYNNLTLDVGEPDDGVFLGYGWLDRERSLEMSFRWATGRASSIVVPLKGVHNYRLELVCAPFAYAGSPAQTIDIFVNRAWLKRIVLEGGVRAYAVDVPARFLRENLNLVGFHYGYAVSPVAAGMSADTRLLAVMFDTVTLTLIPDVFEPRPE